MFKKPVDLKGQASVGGKIAKTLRKGFSSTLGLNEEAVAKLFEKGELTNRKISTSKASVYFLGDLPTLVDEGHGNLFPTAMGLWACPELLPWLEVPSPVSRYLINGADLMLPGVRHISAPISPGMLASVRVIGNPMPMAVGKVLFDPSKSGAGEGKVLQVSHSPPAEVATRRSSDHGSLIQVEDLPELHLPVVQCPGHALIISFAPSAGRIFMCWRWRLRVLWCLRLDRRWGVAGIVGRTRFFRCTATACGRPAGALAPTRGSS